MQDIIYKRDFEDEIERWYTGVRNDCSLIVTGARQVGKTTGIINWANRTGRKIAVFDFSKYPQYVDSICNASSAEEILRIVSEALSKKITNIDVLFLDEIQRHPDSLFLPRLFKDQKIKLICSGSLLGTRLLQHATRTDVGSKAYLQVFPLNFKEFLEWTNNEMKLKLIDDAYKTMTQLSAQLHQELMQLFYKFLIIGGMPNVVTTYINEGMAITQNVYDRKNEIYQCYLNDNQQSFYGYDKNRQEIIKTIDMIFDKMDLFIIQPGSKKFIISEINKNFRYSNVEVPLHILKHSNIALCSNEVEIPQFPLSHHLNESQFKLYYSDVGLLTSKLRLDYNKLVSFQNENTNSAIWGGVVENYVAQELQTIQLYYWKGYLRSKNKYEVDFLLQSSKDGAIIPCEVKSHPKQHKQATSLNAYINEYKPKFVLCVGPNNFGIRDNKHFIPLYAVYKLKQDFDL